MNFPGINISRSVAFELVVSFNFFSACPCVLQETQEVEIIIVRIAGTSVEASEQLHHAYYIESQ